MYILVIPDLRSGIRVESGSIKWNPGRVRVYFTGRIQVILSLLSPNSLSVINTLPLSPLAQEGWWPIYTTPCNGMIHCATVATYEPAPATGYLVVGTLKRALLPAT